MLRVLQPFKIILFILRQANTADGQIGIPVTTQQSASRGAGLPPAVQAGVESTVASEPS